MYHNSGDDMKKVFCFIVCLLLFTGCTNKVTCTMHTAETGRKMDVNLDVIFDNDKAKEVNEVNVLTFDKDFAEDIDDIFDAINVDYKQYENEPGIDIQTSKDKNSIITKIKIIPEKLNNPKNSIMDVDLSKKELIDSLSKEGYACK